MTFSRRTFLRGSAQAIGAASLLGAVPALAAGKDQKGRIGARDITVKDVAGLAVLGGAWGLRLGLHLWHRVSGEAEDGRYAQLRKRWGNAPLKWLAMFQFQALLIALFALPFLAVAANPVGDWNGWFVAGIAAWLLCVGGEALADRQLARFRANPANHGKTCRDGLWRYSRHPNYFFEWLGWCAWPVFAISFSSAWPWGWLALTGPAYIYWLLNHVSGVPLLEAHMRRSRPEAFATYAARTSRFFLRPPKR